MQSDWSGGTARSSDFGTLLRQHRIAANLSQEALAERARISVNGLSLLERGERRRPRRETLALLSDALALNGEQRRLLEAAASASADGRHGPAVAVGPWPSPAIANLPFALTSFVGRDWELTEIGALVRAHRMVTLTGTGGVGKTQTALHVASSIDESASAHACFVALAPITNPLQVVATVASTLGVQEVPSRPLLETLSTYLMDKALFLVLDNCEHMLAEVALIAEVLLGNCPGVRILATSREPLRAAGEYSYRLPALAFPPPEIMVELCTEEALSYGAVRLFHDRAYAVAQGFALTEDNAAEVAELCRRLDGIPLAIELAAARVNLLSVKAISEKLDNRFLILTRGSRTALPRQQTMRATIDWSYDLLRPAEQRVFERLSVFVGGCTLDAAMHVCADEEITAADVFDLLASLVEKSLLVADSERSEPRYRLLESFRHYAAEKLAARCESGDVAHKYALAFYELVCQTGVGDLAPGDMVSLPQLLEELDNLRAALYWTLTERGDVLLGQRMAAALCGMWGKTVTPLEGRFWINSAIELVDDRTPVSIAARLSYGQAYVAWYLDESENQLASSETALAQYRSIGDAFGVARSQSLAGAAMICLGRLSEAQAPMREALTLARDLHLLPLVAFILRGFAFESALRGDIVVARSYLAESLVIYEAEAEKRGSSYMGLAWALMDLAEYDLRGGNLAAALRHTTDVLEASRTGQNKRLTSTALEKSASILVCLGRYDDAEDCAREALDIEREHHWEVMVGWILEVFAAIAAFRPHVNATSMHEQLARASKLLGFAEAHLAELGAPQATAQPEYNRILSLLREALSSDVLAELMALGAAMSEDQAADLALSDVIDGR